MLMKNKLNNSVLVIVACLALTLTGCQYPEEAFTPPPLVTSTPFQPISPTATRTPLPTDTPTLTPFFTPTAIATLTPEPTDPPVNPTESEKSGMVTVPILLYHHISDTIDTQYNVHPDVFAEQMKWLHDNGYTTINISDLTKLILEGGSIPERPVILTFDDGYLDVYKNAYPILQQYGYVATFFIITKTVDTKKNLSTDMLLELIDSGWEIGSHSQTHIDLNQGDNWEEEIIGSKAFLEDKLGVTIQTFAYPYGLANPSVIAYTKNAGYTSAVGLGSQVTHELSTLFYLNRKEVKSWYDLDFFAEFLPWSD